MRQEGQELLKLDRWINVPIMLKPDGTELESLSEDHQVTISYQVTSIVCHRGGTLNSGHYMPLKLTNGDVIICDDDIVAFSADYAAFQQRLPYQSWIELCEREQLILIVSSNFFRHVDSTATQHKYPELEAAIGIIPYLINTVRVDEPLHSPDESFDDFSGESSGGFSDGFSDVLFDQSP